MVLKLSFFQFYCRAYARFRLLALCSTLQALITLPLCLYLIPKWGIAGYLIALSAGFTLITAAVIICCGVRIRFSRIQVWRLLAIGLPMLPGSLMLYLNMSMERIVLASTLNTVAVGAFAAGAFFFQTGATIWELIVYTWYPRIARVYGESGKVKSVAQALREIVPGVLWLSSVLQGCAYILLPPILQRLLPAYVQSVAIAQILILAVNVWGLAQLLSFSMSIIGLQRRSALLQCAFLIAKVVLLAAAMIVFRSLCAVAIACVFALLLYAVFTLFEWDRICGERLVALWQCFILWAFPALCAVASAGLSTTYGIGLPTLLYVAVAVAGSAFLNRRSQAFRQLHVWSVAR